MCKQHALRIAWTIARSIAFLDFRVLRRKFTYDWKWVNTTYRVPLFMPTACFPEGPSPPFTFCSFWRRRQRLEAVHRHLPIASVNDPLCIYTRWLHGFILTLPLMHPDLSIFEKHCRSRPDGFWRRHLIRIHGVFHGHSAYNWNAVG